MYHRVISPLVPSSSFTRSDLQEVTIFIEGYTAHNVSNNFKCCDENKYSPLKNHYNF